MPDTTAQQKRHAPWLRTETNKTEKGWCKVEDQGRFDCISLEGQARSLDANMDPPPAEGNFCDNSNSPMKPHSVEWYNRHMGYIDNSHHMANSYLMNRHGFKWTMKLTFHLMDLTVLNSYILLPPCGAKYAHWDFRLLLVRNLNEEAGKSQDCPTPRLVGRRSAAAINVVRLGVPITNNGQWYPPNSAAVSVHLMARKRAKSMSAPNVTWVCVWYLASRNITPE